MKEEHRKEYIYARGRRKTAVARVRLFPKGKGNIIINGKNLKDYFPYFAMRQTVLSPLQAVGKEKDVDISIKVHGGGTRSQSEAILHGISRALVSLNNDLKKTLKPLGFLTRDPRTKERKKPGLKRARRAPQWQKR